LIVGSYLNGLKTGRFVAESARKVTVNKNKSSQHLLRAKDFNTIFPVFFRDWLSAEVGFSGNKRCL
jgi:hypothetical protein